jgi:hypothetical protein
MRFSLCCSLVRSHPRTNRECLGRWCLFQKPQWKTPGKADFRFIKRNDTCSVWGKQEKSVGVRKNWIFGRSMTWRRGVGLFLKTGWWEESMLWSGKNKLLWWILSRALFDSVSPFQTVFSDHMSHTPLSQTSFTIEKKNRTQIPKMAISDIILEIEHQILHRHFHSSSS